MTNETQVVNNLKKKKSDIYIRTWLEDGSCALHTSTARSRMYIVNFVVAYELFCCLKFYCANVLNVEKVVVDNLWKVWC